MLIEIFILFQVVSLIIFSTAFFTKQEIIWAVSIVFSGMLAFSSWHVEYYIYEFNNTLMAYQPIMTTHNYPYLMAINLLFFVLALVLGIFDLFDKYGSRFVK